MSGGRETHEGVLGTHEGVKADCRYCNLPEGKLVTVEELQNWHATKTMERAEALIDAYGIDAVAMMRFPWQ